MLCKICGNAEGNTTHVAREMMLGLREEFNYLQCSGCGCLQLTQIPPDMAKYYPENYYSYANQRGIASILRHQRASQAAGGLNPFGALVAYFYGEDNAIRSIIRLQVPNDARILDVGCGSGGLLFDLQRLGFESLTGLDPFLVADIESGTVRLLKKDLFEFEGDFDVVMLHHAFEHMDDPASVLAHLKRILSPKGVIVLRIPLKDSYGWEHYGVNWHQLDAPRHFFLHTRKSMAMLAKEARLVISEIVYDSTLLQFAISEEYQRDIPQAAKNSYTKNPLRSIFSLSDIRNFRRRTQQLNQEGNGDSACFYLSKIENEEQ